MNTTIPVEPRISVCGVVEYRCSGTCGDWIREHEAVWVHPDGHIGVAGGDAYCPACAAVVRAAAGPALVH